MAPSTFSRPVKPLRQGHKGALMARYSEQLGTLLGWRNRELALLAANMRAEQAAEAARLSMLSAEAANQAKTVFLASMSHELRTPLNAIIGFSEMMRADLGDEARLESHRGYVQDIHTAGMHLSALVTEVLEYARIAAGQVDLRESELDLGPCIDDSVSMVRHTLEEKALRLERDLSDDFPRLRADGTKLRQVLINLLSNATKFTAPGGRIAVEAFVAAEGELAIDVVDTGAGIAEADLARVMMPFGRGEGAGQGHYGGAGLGLPISRALIEQHGGSLALDSTLGVGTRVSIRLPAGRAVVRNPG